MATTKSKQAQSNGTPEPKNETPGAPAILDVSRRSFLGGATVGGLTAAGLGFSVFKPDSAQAGRDKDPPRHGSKDRVLLKGGIILTLDPNQNANPDLAKGDVLIEGKKIIAIGPRLNANAKVVDCSGLILIPGCVTTHHHQYETVQRAIIADGIITSGGANEQQGTTWPYESYGSVVQSIWTAGRIAHPTTPNAFIWDLGAPPQHPEDLYLSELVASLAQITQGVTCSTDTSQASHTPQHTDAMIKGLMDSGARALYDYSAGTARAAIGDVSKTGYEFPGAVGEEKWGVGRLRKKYFSSDDQLVTLGLNANQNAVVNRKTGATESYSGWELAKEFSCWINNHNVGAPTTLTGTNNQGRSNKAQLEDPDIGAKLTLVHAVRWQDHSVAQVGAAKAGYPNPATSEAWQVAHDTGVHISIACPLEQQMRHGVPPIQMSLNYGIMPSLSPDVDTNQSSDAFTLMRGAFNLQRGLANDLAFDLSDPGRIPMPQLLTCYQVLQMATHAGAVGSGLGSKVGLLKVGYEADIVFLETKSIDIAPLHNAPGAVVTLMDTSHVKHVMIAGKFKYWNYELVGWNVDKLVRDIEKSRERMLKRIRAVPLHEPGKNTPINPYTPPLLTSCCYVGQNENPGAPGYVLGPGGNLRA